LSVLSPTTYKYLVRMERYGPTQENSKEYSISMLHESNQTVCAIVLGTVTTKNKVIIK
jgi:hypothetical protein